MSKNIPQEKLKRMAWYFEEEGIYTKSNYCLEIADYITELEEFQNNVFEVYPNVDLDIDFMKRKSK